MQFDWSFFKFLKMSLRNKVNGIKEVWQFENRWWLITTKILFPGERIHIYRYKGLDVLIDHAAGDANGAREILTSPMYRRFLPKMKLDRAINVLDLGANNGGFPLLLQTNGIPLKKVVSVELNPNTFVRLRFNLERNLPCQVIALNAALCGENGWLEISLGTGSVSDSIYEDNAADNAQVYKIEGITLDEIYTRYFMDEIVDICKIDVEGAEFDVFTQSSHTHLRRCRYLIMEIHERGGKQAAEILPIIERLGFVNQPLEPDADPTVYFFINSTLQENGITKNIDSKLI